VSVARGFLWFLFNTAFVKSLTFITQLVLGWILMPEDFGVYAIAVSIGVFISMLRNGGIEQVLIQKGELFTRLRTSATLYSFAFNFLGMILLLLLAPVIADLYNDERLFYMLVIMSLVLPIGTPAVLYRVKLSVDKRYKELSLVRAVSSSVRQIMIVVFAINGFGVYSFVLPMIIEVVIESLHGFYYTKLALLTEKFNIGIVKELFVSGKWLMLTSVMLGLSTTGDFFVLGLLLDKEQLGIYFFGLQIVVAIAAIFSTAIQGVLLPALVPSVNDSDKFSALYTQALSKIFFITLPASIILSFVSSPFIHWAWSGKWDGAIQVTQIMFIAMPFWLMVFLSRSSLEALGMWKRRLAYLAIYGISSLLVATTLGSLGSILYVAIGVAVIRALIGILQSLSIYSLIGQSCVQVVKQFSVTLFVTAVSALLAMTVFNFINTANVLAGLVIFVLIFSLLYLLLSYKFQYENLTSIAKLLRFA